MGYQFGASAAVEGDTAVIGAIFSTPGGAAYVFTRSLGFWTEVQKLTASDGAAGDTLGKSTAMDGDSLIIGAPDDDGNTGSAYLFKRTAGVWTELQKLTASDGVAGDNFGAGVALHANTAIVGALNDGDNGDASGSTYVFSPITVDIDIKPGSDPNSINPRSKGKIPVAILTTSIVDGDSVDFDATQVDPLSALFGTDGAIEAHGRGHGEDIDGDGDIDLVLHFNTQQTGIACGDTEATLTGQTFAGDAINGTDSINTVGC